MTYYVSKTVGGSFEDVVVRSIADLKEKGFGIVTDLDIQKTLKENMGTEFRKYRILGACNPKLAHEALLLEDKIGTMLPCNVVIQQRENEDIEVAAVDPAASMQAVANPKFKEAAQRVGEKLKRAIAAI